jgi:hypothetical protein
MPLMAIAATIAVLVVASQVNGGDSQIAAILILFVPVAMVAGIALFKVVDARTRRERLVTPLADSAKRAKKSVGSPGEWGTAAKPDRGQMDWQIGPGAPELLLRWLGTLFFLGVAAALGVAAHIASGQWPGRAGNEGVTTFCLVSAIMPLLIWASVVRFRVSGQIVTVERPFALFRRPVSFDLSEIDEVDVSHWPHDRKTGKCLKITLKDGRRVKYSQVEHVVDAVEERLRSAIELSRPVPHPLSDDAIR